jgi:hypothetical protein
MAAVVTMAGRQLPAGANRDFSGFPADDVAAPPPLIPNQSRDAQQSARWTSPGVTRAAKTHESMLILTTGEGNPTVGQDAATGVALTEVTTWWLARAFVQENIRSGSTFPTCAC